MKLTTKEIVLFPLLGTIMFISKLVTEFLPNVHLIAMFTIAFTVVLRKKALIPIFIFILLTGLYGGFSLWWVPYLYLWPILWAVTMLLPIQMKPKTAPLVYMVVSALFGFLYGTMYAPFQALAFGLNFDGMITWIIAGLPWDITHGISNFFVAILTIPVIKALEKGIKLIS